MASRPVASAANPAPLTFLLHWVGKRVDEAMARAADAPTLSVVQAKFLRHLIAKPEGVTLAELADLAGCTRANVTQMLTRLELAGLTERRDNPADARSARALATADGMKAFRQVERDVMEFERRLVAALGEDKADRLWRALRDVLEAV